MATALPASSSSTTPGSWIVDRIGEDGGAAAQVRGTKPRTQPLAIEDVVAEDERDRIPPEEIRADEERSEEHTSELQSLMRISYAVFCLKKKNNTKRSTRNQNTREADKDKE